MMEQDDRTRAATFSIFDVRQSSGHLLPILCTDEPGGVRIEASIIRYMRFLDSRGTSLTQMRAQIFALGLLRDFYLHAWRGDLFRPHGLMSLVAAFLRARRSGLHLAAIFDRDGDVERSMLVWSPVSNVTVWRDRRSISSFASFCCVENESFSILPMEPAQAEQCRADLDRLFVMRAPPVRSSDMLMHIAHARRLRAYSSIGGYAGGHLHFKSQRSKPTLRHYDVRRLIDLTSSPMQKMLLIEAFFGGPRLSEMLHQWRCDVLPGQYRPMLFEDDVASETPLAILAHPADSSYTGPLNDQRQRRSQYLLERHGRHPRTMMRCSGEHAGWKGIAFDNPNRYISQIFWSNHEFAQMFLSLFRDICYNLYSRIAPEVLSSHPYLFVNDDPTKKEFGHPLKLSNARKIFRRAIKRIDVDIEPMQCGSHVARHYYACTIDGFNLSDDDQAKCMHHRSVQSQKNYARNAVAARDRLDAAMKQGVAP